MDDGPTSFFQSRRPAEVDTDALPTPTVDDCPTPLLAAMTGLHKLSLSKGLGAPWSLTDTNDAREVELRVHVEPNLTHCQPPEAESFV